MADVYWHRGRRLWSVREGGRVVGHVEAIALQGVTLRTSEAARIRCLRSRARDVHAWASGIVAELSRPADAVRLRYRLSEPGFRAEGAIVMAAAAWFEADGSAWCLSPADETVMIEREDLRCA